MSVEDRLYPLLGVYNSLPPWLQSSAGTLYRALPRSWRLGKQFSAFAKLAAAAETWDPEQIHEYQLKELRRVLHHANNHCPFYQKAFARSAFRPENIRSVEDLVECPILEKRQLLDHREELVSDAVPKRERL